MEKILLVVERSADELHGRVIFEDNLLVETADSVLKIENSMKDLLCEFHDLKRDDIEFEVVFDVTGVFKRLPFLRIDTVAKIAGMKAALLRQYSTGARFATAEVALQIEQTIRALGNELSKIHVYAD